MKKVITVAIPALVAAAFPTWADETALRRCRAIAEAPARLACYDSIPLGAAGTRPSPSAPAASTPPKGAPAVAARPAPAAPGPAERFGLEDKAQRPADDLETIASYIPGHFEGWRPRMHIRLANGQVWQVIDDSTRFLSLENPKVVVRRGMLGAFFLDIENDNRSPRVRRVQ